MGIAGWILFILSFIGVLYVIWPKGSEVDFAGFVNEVKIDPDSQDVYVTVNEPLNNVTVEIKILKGTRCKTLNNKPFNLSDIKPGDFIEVNYKKPAELFEGKYKATAKGPVKISPPAER